MHDAARLFPILFAGSDRELDVAGLPWRSRSAVRNVGPPGRRRRLSCAGQVTVSVTNTGFRPDRPWCRRSYSCGTLLLCSPQLQPLVLPQPSQTKQLPAGRIFVPQFMQSGASADVPMIDSTSSVELCAVGGASCAVSTTTSSWT